MGRPLGGPNKDKPFREALRMEVAAAGDDLKWLRKVAIALLAKAASGDVGAIKELADRLDGKAPQPHSGDDDAPIQHIHKIERIIVRPTDTNS